MTAKLRANDVTMVKGAIHNANEARHFMRVKPTGKRITARIGDQTIAQSYEALRVVEVGRDIYDPVIYFPRDAVKIPLQKQEKSTHCPIKGDASYFDSSEVAGSEDADYFAWAYENPKEGSEVLTGYVAFNAYLVTMEEKPNV